MAYYEDIVVDESDKTKCELCNVFLYSDSSIEVHQDDRNHNRLFVERLMNQNGMQRTGHNVNCLLCGQVLDATKVLLHIESKHHNSMMETVKHTTLKDGGFLILPENKTNQGAAVNCLICDRTVKFNLKEIEIHIASVRHRRARSIAVQPLNGIFSVENTNDDLWCKICQVYFENYIETVFEHVDDDPRHNSEIAKLFLLIKDQNINIEKFFLDPKEDKAVCNKCNLEVPCNVDNLGSHVRGKKHNS